jgi:hypothetical protein
MSKLLYPRIDPEFHAVVSAGIALTGLLMIPFAGYIGRRLRVISALSAEIGALIFGAGAISLILGALIVWQPFHEIFARSAGTCLGLGMLAFYVCGLRAIAVPSNEKFPSNEGYARLRLFFAWSLIVVPALVIVVLRVLAGAHLDWPNPIYRAIENRSLWHLGFWEWMISAAVFLFMLGGAVYLPEND